MRVNLALTSVVESDLNKDCTGGHDSIVLDLVKDHIRGLLFKLSLELLESGEHIIRWRLLLSKGVLMREELMLRGAIETSPVQRSL